MSLLRIAAATSSVLLRLAALIFLRWIPGRHFPPIVFTSLVIYLSSWPSLARESSASPRRSDGKDRDGRKSTKRPTPAGSVDSALKTLLTGLPSARSPFLSRFTALINIVLTLFTLDFLLRGLLLYSGEDMALSRIGYVSPTTASLLVREPDPAQLPLTVYYQEAAEADASKWTEEGIIYTLDFKRGATFRNVT